MSDSLLAGLVRKYGADQLHSMMTAEQRLELQFCWAANARSKQLPPAWNWRWWFMKPGRGFGKTRSGAEWCRMKRTAMPGSAGALIGRTPVDVDKVMIHGPSGILACSPPWDMPVWRVSRAGGQLQWPDGTTAHAYSGQNPKSFRGPQWHWVWCDEFPHWQYPRESYNNINFGLRLEWNGVAPQGLITATPLPIAVVLRILKDPRNAVTGGSTFENAANLSQAALEDLRTEYEGTRLGRQELEGEVLEDVPGALWRRDMFNAKLNGPGTYDRIVVAIDPAVTANEESDLTGIVGAGRRVAVPDERASRFDVLADRSCRESPNTWATIAINLFDELKADRFIAEVNNGGDLVEAVLQQAWRDLGRPGSPPYRAVNASRGKRTRAEPIAAMYEQGRVSHVKGLEDLEDQMAVWVPGVSKKSPDRMDAAVWALTELSTSKRVFIT